MQFRTHAKQASGRGGVAVSPDTTITGAPLLQGKATADSETAKGGAVGTRAEGNRLRDGSPSRTAQAEARGWSRPATRRGRNKAEGKETRRAVLAGSTRQAGPNEARHRIAALLRFLLNLKMRVVAARGALER